MNRLYRKTFDQVRMPAEKALSMRAELASRCSDNEKEDIMNKKHLLRRPVVLAAAVLLICALSVTALAYGGQITQLMCGAVIETVLDENGDNQSSVHWDTGNSVSPVETRDDGRVYFVLNGEEWDITGEFTYELPYIHEYTDALNQRHAFIVGGGKDAVGWGEFIWDDTGLILGGSTSFGTPGGSEDAPWFHAAMDILGLPW